MNSHALSAIAQKIATRCNCAFGDDLVTDLAHFINLTLKRKNSLMPLTPDEERSTQGYTNMIDIVRKSNVLQYDGEMEARNYLLDCIKHLATSIFLGID